jgi:hypothetical protein
LQRHVSPPPASLEGRFGLSAPKLGGVQDPSQFGCKTRNPISAGGLPGGRKGWPGGLRHSTFWGPGGPNTKLPQTWQAPSPHPWGPHLRQMGVKRCRVGRAQPQHGGKGRGWRGARAGGAPATVSLAPAQKVYAPLNATESSFLLCTGSCLR